MLVTWTFSVEKTLMGNKLPRKISKLKKRTGQGVTSRTSRLSRKMAKLVAKSRMILVNSTVRVWMVARLMKLRGRSTFVRNLHHQTRRSKIKLHVGVTCID